MELVGVRGLEPPTPDAPYQWDAQNNETEHWLGGIKLNGENLSTFDALKETLNNDFELHDTLEVDTTIRLNARCSQTTNNQVTIWQKR